MKISILSFVLFGLLFVSSCAAIAEYQIRILLNRGANTTSMSCSSDEMELVMKSLLFTRRHLRQGTNEVEKQQSLDEDDSSGNGRKLLSKFYPASCKKSCEGYATGTCVAPACKGNRRGMEDIDNEERDLQFYEMLWCEGAKNNVQNFLNFINFGGMVSKSCQKLLSAPRKLECLTVVC